MDSFKFGNFISERRKLIGLTQRELADRLGVTNKAISRWETGEGYPDITMITELALIFSVTADELLSGELKPGSNSMVTSEVPEESGYTVLEPVFVSCKENIAKRKRVNVTGVLMVTCAAIIILMAFIFSVSSVVYSSAEITGEQEESQILVRQREGRIREQADIKIVENHFLQVD